MFNDMTTPAQIAARRIQGRKLCYIGGVAAARKSFTIPQSGPPIIRALFQLLHDHHMGDANNICRRAGVYRGVISQMRRGRNVSIHSVEALLNVMGHTLTIARLPGDSPCP